jgi:hypothetical protein
MHVISSTIAPIGGFYACDVFVLARPPNQQLISRKLCNRAHPGAVK